MEIAKPEWLEQMEAILETLNEGILISDDCDHVLFVNSVFEEMTGMSRADIVGRDAGKLYYSPEDFVVLEELRRKTRQMGRSRDEFYLPTKGGGRLPIVASVRTIEDPEGRLFAIAAFTDISEQKAAEQDLRTANTQLEKRQKEIEEDLVLAARVQQSLAPKSMIWGGMRVETFYHPVRTIGGDFGLVSPLDEDHLNVLVGDVSGHGISSALIANRIYSETIAQLNNGAPLGDMLRQLNHFVIQNIGSSLFFFTLSVARLDRSQVREHAVLETEGLDRAGIDGVVGRCVVAARYQNDLPVIRCDADLVGKFSGIEPIWLGDAFAERAVRVDAMHRQAGGVVVGGEEVLARQVDAGVDRTRG